MPRKTLARKKRSPAPHAGTDSTIKAGTPPAPDALVVRRTSLKPQSLAAPAPAKRAGGQDPPRSHRELAEAIFSQCDPIAVGRELLESGGSERGGSVKARVWERLVEFLLGKPAPAPSKQERPLQIIWDIPGPRRDPSDH